MNVKRGKLMGIKWRIKERMVTTAADVIAALYRREEVKPEYHYHLEYKRDGWCGWLAGWRARSRLSSDPLAHFSNPLYADCDFVPAHEGSPLCLALDGH